MKAQWQRERDADRRACARKKEQLEQLKTEAERAAAPGRLRARVRAALRLDARSSRRSIADGHRDASRSCARRAASCARRSPRTTSPRSSRSGPASRSRRCSRARSSASTKMEDRLRARVVGQDAAVTAVAAAVRRARAGLKDPNRPIGSFLFLGPTGVGKTELARALAEFLFDDETAMIRIDMSRVPGEAHGVAAGRRASGLRRLRPGRPAHRGRAPPPVQRSCCSTRSRRRTPTCGACCCRCSTTAGSPTARAARSTSRTPSSS